MMMSVKVSNHRILVEKADLTSKGLFPSSQELYELMHLVSCTFAEARWKDHWSFCPVCCAFIKDDGTIRHFNREEIKI